MRQPFRHSEHGYSVTEMLIVVAIIGIISAMAVFQAGVSTPSIRGDSAMRVILGQMRTARERAITERRYMRVSFTVPNKVEIIREEVPGPSTTVVGSTFIEGGVGYGLIAGLPDTPDAFGRSTPINFGIVTNVKFTPEGTLVNQDGSTVNGSVFLAISQTSLSARAVTVLGSTGRIRGYRWDGRAWKLV